MCFLKTDQTDTETIVFNFPKITFDSDDLENDHAYHSLLWAQILDKGRYINLMPIENGISLQLLEEDVKSILTWIQDWIDAFYVSLLHGKTSVDLTTMIHNKGMERILFLSYGFSVKDIENGIRVEWLNGQ